MRTLEYGRGQIFIEGEPVYLENLEPMHSFPAHMYNQVIDHLDESGEQYIDKAPDGKAKECAGDFGRRKGKGC